MRPLHILGALAVALGACFSDEGGGGSGTTGVECPAGANGCPCYGNGTCNEGLECSMGACVVPGCTPGALDCNCSDGLCLGDLVCEAGACHEPPVSSEASGATPTTSDSMSGPETTVTTTDSAESVGTSPPTDSGMSMCGDGSDCQECKDCAMLGPCSDQYTTCQRDPVCESLMLCLAMCPLGSDACASDCALANMGGEVLFEPLAQCVNCECAAPCKVPCAGG